MSNNPKKKIKLSDEESKQFMLAVKAYFQLENLALQKYTDYMAPGCSLSIAKILEQSAESMGVDDFWKYDRETGQAMFDLLELCLSIITCDKNRTVQQVIDELKTKKKISET